MRHDAVEPIAALANSKFALDNVSVTDILILLFLCLFRPFRVLYRSFSGEIVHFVWAAAEDIQKLPSVQKPVREPISRGKSSSLRSVTSTSSTGPLA